MKETFLPYSAEEYATEALFIAWVKATDPELNRKWAAWLEAHPEVIDTVEQAIRMVQQMEFNPVSIPTNTEALWRRIDDSIAQISPTDVKPEIPFKKLSPVKVDHQKSTTSRIKVLYLISTIAACLSLVLLWIWLSPQIVNVSTARGEHLVYTLPDSSVIRINSDTEIRFQKRKWATNRQLKLEGEAFFEVEKGAKFIVKTDVGTIEVLGTSFNVYSRQRAFQVACLTGQVKVTVEPEKKSVILDPGETIDLRNGTLIEKRLLEDLEKDSWIQGNYRFKGIPYQQVIEELERQYDVQIQLEAALRDTLYTGFFRGDDLEGALYSICWPLGLYYSIDKKQVLITADSTKVK